MGWLFGRSKRKAEDSSALLSSIDTQSNAFRKQVELNEELATKYASVFEENVSLREQVVKQANELDALKEKQQELQKEVETLRGQLAALMKTIAQIKTE